jgi:hypothetical protein
LLAADPRLAGPDGCIVRAALAAGFGAALPVAAG